MEKILFKKRVLKALSVCLLINIVDIIECYYNLLEMYKDEVIDSIAFNRTLVSGDFHSLLQYGVVYMFIYIIYIVYIMEDDKIYKIIRYEQRKSYYFKTIKKVFYATFLFVLIHELTSVVYILLFGNWSILIKHNWIMGIFGQILITFLYYNMAFFVYSIMQSKWVRGASIVNTMMIMILQYYISVKFFEFIYMPIKDIGIMVSMCGYGYSFRQCLGNVFRLVVITVIVGGICLEVKNREDIL